VDPIEIDAGTSYLRRLRADDLLDDTNTLCTNGFEMSDGAARAVCRIAPEHREHGIAGTVLVSVLRFRYRRARTTHDRVDPSGR
jgi:hypothetical protein